MSRSIHRCNRKWFLSNEEKILLHLFTYYRYQQDDTAPPSVTQEGIAVATGIGRNNVSKIVAALAADGDIEIKKKHVKGLPSIRNVYSLTPNGFKKALSLKEEIENTRITVIDFNGNEISNTVGNLNSLLPKSYSLLELALCITRGTFNCLSFHEMKVKEERKFVDFTDKKPTVRFFVGRKNELKRLEDFLNSDDKKIAVIYGIPGIGKTTLLAKFALDVRTRTNAFWYRLTEWTSPRMFLSPLAEFLSQLGKKGLERLITQTENPTIGQVCHILESDFKNANIFIFLDDVHKADSKVLELLRAMVRILEHMEGVKIACTSRIIPSFYSRGDVISGLVDEIALEGLDRESCIQLLRSRSIPERNFDELIEATKGHPFFLELVRKANATSERDMRMFLEQEVYSTLDLAERRILEIASVFRYPVPVDAFFMVEEFIAKESGIDSLTMRYNDFVFDHDALDDLFSRFLLQESMGRMVAMHDLLRDFFYSRLTPRQKAIYHKAAARFYLTDTSSGLSLVEALYHSVMSGDWRTALQIAVGSGRQIISKGLASNMAPLVEKIVSQHLETSIQDRVDLFLIHGEILELQGEWDLALKTYEGLLKIDETELGKRKLGEIYRRIGSLYLRKTEFQSAQVMLEKSLMIGLLSGDNYLLSTVYYDLGGIAERRGQYSEAITFFSKAKMISEQIGEDIGLGKALYGLGRVYGQLLDYDKAIEFKKKAIAIIGKTGDAKELAKVYTSLGNDYRFTNQYEKSFEINNKAIDLANSSGDINTQGYALSNAVALYIEIGDLEKAEGALKRAIEIFQKIDDKIMMATMRLYRGYLYVNKSEWNWAKEEFIRALDILRPLGVPLKLSNWLFEISQVCIENKDYNSARLFLSEAHELASMHGYDNLKKEIEATFGLLPSSFLAKVESETNSST
ncbi:MAG: tetratricopeptide repeat protein [Methanomassiliicoccales archaeon]